MLWEITTAWRKRRSIQDSERGYPPEAEYVDALEIAGHEPMLVVDHQQAATRERPVQAVGKSLDGEVTGSKLADRRRQQTIPRLKVVAGQKAQMMATGEERFRFQVKPANVLFSWSRSQRHKFSIAIVSTVLRHAVALQLTAGKSTSCGFCLPGSATEHRPAVCWGLFHPGRMGANGAGLGTPPSTNEARK
jgi:hypothetical protein